MAQLPGGECITKQCPGTLPIVKQGHSKGKVSKRRSFFMLAVR